ncbi:MAG: FG-GAP repeat protein [Spirochaetia bacterium]|nr:FG-GAP repeat protein [Spirochaetia bacterium]
MKKMKNEIYGKTAGLVSVIFTAAAVVMLFTACEDTLMRQSYKAISGASEWKIKQTVTAGIYAGEDYIFGGYTSTSPGNPVDIDGKRAIIGSLYEGSSGEGAAYIFHLENGTWKRKTRLTGSAGDSFGYSVAISGSYAVVGAIGKSGGGAVHIYQWDGSDWNETKTIVSPSGSPEVFGSAVDIDGDYIVTADYGFNSNEGSAYVFYRNQGGTDNWGFQNEVGPDDTSSGDFYGCAVAIKGDYLIGGAYRQNTDFGAAYIYERSGDTWYKRETLLCPDETGIVLFGSSVAINDTGVTVAAPDVSSVYYFEKEGTNWLEAQKIQAAGGAAADLFGATLSLSEQQLVISAPRYNSNTQRAFYTFFLHEGEWVQLQRFVWNDSDQGSILIADPGVSVAVDGNYALVGLPGDDTEATDAGAAVFLHFE